MKKPKFNQKNEIDQHWQLFTAPKQALSRKKCK
jgi:hypothetical protein